jgi:limonene-1,2-epoxide hydrolase
MTALEVVRRWVAAVNALDIPAVMACSAGDIELGGPRGTTRGQPRLREWVERGGLRMDTRRTFAAGDRAVLAQRVPWRDRAGMAIAEASIASRFAVSGDRITAVVRYDSLLEALEDAGLSEEDEVEG